MIVPFNKPHLTGGELTHLAEALASGQLGGGRGGFAQRCAAWLKTQTGCCEAFVTHSCTAALEMAAILADIRPGDEVIVPSFTFVSTANAFVMRGAVPVFVDIRADTLNIDETRIEAAITPRTRVIVPMHYGGVGCEMDAIMDIAARHKLLVVEDAAHGSMAYFKNRALGAIGHLGCLSFHETKNLTCGEGGALLINDPALATRAEVVAEKGLDRQHFLRGQVDRYTWIDLGSSYLPSELSTAVLWAQLQAASGITERRLGLWRAYHHAFAAAERAGAIRRPGIPPHCAHNGHIYYLLLPRPELRAPFIRLLNERGIQAVFHYSPLDQAPQGRRSGRAHGSLETTWSAAARLVRLPLWLGLEAHQARVIDQVLLALRDLGS